MNLDIAIERLSLKIEPLAKFINAFAASIDQPQFRKSETEHGFRYQNPQLHHFLLLRGVRIVSALNASIKLAKAGFSQEIAVLLRTQAEYTSQIDFMLASRDATGQLSKKAESFLLSYFEDAHRPPISGTKRAKLVQKEVHEVVGARHDKEAAKAGIEVDRRKPAQELLSNVYIILSNYVHGRYPESMDLFGGRPGHFHLNGMTDTPKDLENIAILDTLILAASNCLKGIVHDLRLYYLAESDQMLRNWLSE